MIKHIIVFCDMQFYKRIANDILLGICDFVNCRTRYEKTVFDIDEKEIRIELRPANIIKAAGLRPTHVLFYTKCYEFIEDWRHCMNGRYTELNTLDDLIRLVNNSEGEAK